MGFSFGSSVLCIMKRLFIFDENEYPQSIRMQGGMPTDEDDWQR